MKKTEAQNKMFEIINNIKTKCILNNNLYAKIDSVTIDTKKGLLTERSLLGISSILTIKYQLTDYYGNLSDSEKSRKKKRTRWFTLDATNGFVDAASMGSYKKDIQIFFTKDDLVALSNIYYEFIVSSGYIDSQTLIKAFKTETQILKRIKEIGAFDKIQFDILIDAYKESGFDYFLPQQVTDIFLF